MSTRSLRYYEEQGLLVGERLANGYRDYAPDAVDTVAFIQDLFSAGLPSDIVRDVLPCAHGERPTGDCTALVARAHQVRAALVEQEERIAQRRRTLDRFLAEARPDPVEKTAQRQQRDPGMGREERVNP